MSFTAPEKLSDQHAMTEFDCGNHDLNRFLKSLNKPHSNEGADDGKEEKTV